MEQMTREQLLERIFHDDFENLKGKTLRMTRVRVPSTEVCLANIINPTDRRIYENLGLHIGVHEGEDHMGETIGIVSFTPWETTVAAADVALKAADVEIGFLDRFCGTLIVTGDYMSVQTAVEEVVRFCGEELGFATCEIKKN